MRDAHSVIDAPGEQAANAAKAAGRNSQAIERAQALLNRQAAPGSRHVACLKLGTGAGPPSLSSGFERHLLLQEASFDQ